MKDHLHEETGKVFPRGAKPTPRHLLCASMPFRAAAAPPTHFFIFPRKLGMWLNATYGVCVTTEEAFNKACNGIYITDETVLKWAGDRDLLNGANLQPVIQQMQQDGFHQDGNIYGDGSALAVNYGDTLTMQAAIYQSGQQGGCIKFGLAADELPSGAGNKNGWFLTSNNYDTNEDHCMGACGYGTALEFVTAMNEAYGLSLTIPSGVDPTMQGYAVFTWSTIGFCSIKAFVNMTGEAWIRSPSSVNTGTGTPNPDSVYVTGAPVPPTPTPTPTPNPPGPTPTPTPPPVRQVVIIQDQTIQVPGFFGSVHNVTVKGGTYPVVTINQPGF